MNNIKQKTISILLALNTSVVVAGEGIIPTPDYTGSVLERSTVSGDWGGVRQNLAEKGFQADFKVVTTYQNMFDGGINHDDGFVSTQELLLQLDTGKADLWAGGLFKFRVQSRVGDALEDVGAFSPVNTPALFPVDDDIHDGENIAITELVYTQFLSAQFGVFAGLLDTTEDDENILASHVSSSSKFMNRSFSTSLIAPRTVQSVTLGAGLIFIPTDWLLGTFVIMDTEESAGQDPFSSSKGTTLSSELKAKYELGGLPGAQTFGFLYAYDNEFLQTDQGLQGSFPLGIITGESLEYSSDSWGFYHNAHQYIQYENGSGWGFFTRFGIAERDTNPIDWSVAVGVSGNGLFSSRPKDTYGIGYFHLQLTETPLFEALDMNDENGFEIWYNAEITPWFHLTADLQIIDTAFGSPTFDKLPGNIVGNAVGEGETAWIAGFRTEIKF